MISNPFSKFILTVSRIPVNSSNHRWNSTRVYLLLKLVESYLRFPSEGNPAEETTHTDLLVFFTIRQLQNLTSALLGKKIFLQLRQNLYPALSAQGLHLPRAPRKSGRAWQTWQLLFGPRLCDFRFLLLGWGLLLFRFDGFFLQSAHQFASSRPWIQGIGLRCISLRI